MKTTGKDGRTDWTCLDKTGHDWTRLNMTGHDWTLLDMTGHDWTITQDEPQLILDLLTLTTS